MRNIDVLHKINNIIDSAICVKDYINFINFDNNQINKVIISMTTQSIYVNNTEIVNINKSCLQFKIFKILIEQHVNNFINCKHEYISSAHIAKLINRPEDVVWKTIYSLRMRMKKKFIKDNIIESSKWSGYKLTKQVMVKLI